MTCDDFVLDEEKSFYLNLFRNKVEMEFGLGSLQDKNFSVEGVSVEYHSINVNSRNYNFILDKTRKRSAGARTENEIAAQIHNAQKYK